MANFTVTWVREAEAEAATLWMEADDRAVVAAAIDEIDRLLRLDPHGVGESRDGDNRILPVWPLAVTYVISDEDRQVTVLEVWRHKGKS
jgi:hypothetical protein